MTGLPRVDLTAYLEALAQTLGYELDLDELDTTTGVHPDLIIGWAKAGAIHAALTYATAVLDGPIEFFTESPVDWSEELEELRARRRRLEEHLDTAGQRYAAACQRLLSTPFVWIRDVDASPPKPRPNGTARTGPEWPLSASTDHGD